MHTLNYPRLDVTAANGVPFRAVFVPADAAYPNHPAAKRLSDQPLIEFYDRRYPHTQDGQFVGARYYVSTIRNGDAGLILDGGIPNWQIDADTMRLVRTWLTHCLNNG